MSKVLRICDLLDEHYGVSVWTHPEPVLDELILTILSQNTTAKNCNDAFNRLRSRFPKWENALPARWEEIADAIRVGGLAYRKAPRIKAILESVYERQGNLDLDWVAELSDKEAVDYLMRFDGVGIKTAACVLMFGLGRPVMPVDTHVHRVSTRLGIIPQIDVVKAHDLLQKIVPPEKVYSCHVNMVTHGRRICHARSPVCEQCILNGECDYFAERHETRR